MQLSAMLVQRLEGRAIELEDEIIHAIEMLIDRTHGVPNPSSDPARSECLDPLGSDDSPSRVQDQTSEFFAGVIRAPCHFKYMILHISMGVERNLLNDV